MARQTAAQKTKVLAKYQCGSCNDVFTGKICPTCGEKVNIFPINADGISTDEVASAVGATHGLPLNLTRSPENFDPDEAMETAVRRQMKDSIQEAQLSKAKTLAAEQAAKQLRAEETLEATKQGFKPLEPGDEQQQQAQSGFASINPAMMMQMLGGWEPEQREHFLNYLNANPMTALHLSMMMNPGKSGGMNQMGMMNPMAMMGGMMQPQVEPAPQTDPATMLTAVIAAVQTMQEMSGGGKGNDAQMERMLDKMDDMRKETEDLKLKLIEAQTTKNDVTHEDIRRIVADAVNTTTDGKIGLINGLKEIHTLRDELIGLGIAQEPSNGIDPAQTLEERKFDHQVKIDDRRDKQEHELRLKAEESDAAREDAKGAFLNGLFAASQEQNVEKEAEKEAEKPIDVVRVDARQASVIS